MEAIIDVLQALHLNLLEVGLTGVIIFCIGYWFGTKKVKKLTQEMYDLQKHVLDLNAELLFGDEDSNKTPVIGIKPDALKGSMIAK